MESVSPETAPAPPESLDASARSPARALRFRDFLFPQELLARTDADDNPLVVRGRRQSTRPEYFALRVLIECALLLGAFYLLLPDTKVDRVLAPFLFLIAPPGSAKVFRPLWWMAYAAMSFGLLRYHLLVNDQATHLKSLTRDELEHLLLTRLTREDYFLHHLLLFCLRYRVVIAWAAMVCLHGVYAVVTWDVRWVDPEFWRPAQVGLALVLYTWAGGVWQYVHEWKHYAGGRRRITRPIQSLAYSVVVAGVCGCVAAGAALLPPWYAVPATLLIFAGAACLAFREGSAAYLDSTELLWERFSAGDADWHRGMASRDRTVFGLIADLLIPSRWLLIGKMEKEARGETPPLSTRERWNDRWVAAGIMAGPFLWCLLQTTIVNKDAPPAFQLFSRVSFVAQLLASIFVCRVLARIAGDVLRAPRAVHPTIWGPIGPHLPRLAGSTAAYLGVCACLLGGLVYLEITLSSGAAVPMPWLLLLNAQVGIAMSWVAVAWTLLYLGCVLRTATRARNRTSANPAMLAIQTGFVDAVFAALYTAVFFMPVAGGFATHDLGWRFGVPFNWQMTIVVVVAVGVVMLCVAAAILRSSLHRYNKSLSK